MIITIDGPSGTGKSTVARGVAKKLGYSFFDTGAMYRSFAWYLRQQKGDPTNPATIRELLTTYNYAIQTDEQGERHYFVNGKEITGEIRTQEISNLASQVAVYPEVRQNMVKIQREFGASTHAVFEGRDMGTVVFPKAELKIFLTARPEIRAARRYRELVEKFPHKAKETSLEQILKETLERDHTDTARKVSPLKIADDATLIDTSETTAEEVIEKIIQLHLKVRFP